MLLDELLAWRASLRDPAPDSPFFPTRTGNRRTKDNINSRVIRPAGRRANERRARRELPPLPDRVTAHTLRRTYISMMLAAGAEIPYVMAQVGHEDSKVSRPGGTRRTGPRPGLNPFICAEIGPKTGPKRATPPRSAPKPLGRSNERTPAMQGVLRVELGGLEPPTSWVRSRRSPN